jgi:hypothetical protein
MTMPKRIPAALVSGLLVAALLACSLPGGQTPPDLTATFGAALTSAFGTALAANPGGPAPSATLPPPPAATAAPTSLPAATSLKPSDTPAPSNTPGAQGCSDGAAYVADVTIPDNTVLNPGQAFTKIWRLQNSGGCTWVSAYQFTFIADNPMGAPASVAISGNVAPGSLYDVSVPMVAPGAPGAYKSTWQMRNAAGQFFGSLPFVQIIVAAPTATATPITPTAAPTATPVATNTPVNTPANTPTNTSAPAVAFTAGFAGTWSCGTQPRVNFQIINTGGLTLESMRIQVEGPVGTYLNGNTQNAPFHSSPTQASPDCMQAGSESLAPGSAAWVNTNVPAIPSGAGGKAVINLCSLNDLGGGCL